MKELLRQYLEEYDLRISEEEESLLVSAKETEHGVFPLDFTIYEPKKDFSLWLHLMTFPADYTITDEMMDLIELANQQISRAELLENGTGVLILISPNQRPITFSIIDNVIDHAVNLAKDFLPAFQGVYDRKISPETGIASVLQVWKRRGVEDRQ